MMMSPIILSVVLFNLVLSDDRQKPRSSKACDDSYECQAYNLDLYNAKCFGYYGCTEATIDLEAALCTGAFGCYDAAKIEATGRVFCNGFQACSMAGSITSTTDSVVCDGDRACKNIDGDINADGYVLCDGNGACQTGTIISGRSTTCAGVKSCKGASITAADNVYCDGDTSCADTTIDASNIRCYGKRVCKGSTINVNGVVNAFGFFAAAGSTINAQIVNAIGFNALSKATVDSQGNSNLNVKAYGYRAAVGATIICRAGSTCTLQCKGIACKKANLLCETGSTCNVSPPECLPDNSVLKFQGDFCPTITENATPPMIRETIQRSKTDTDFDKEMEALLNELEAEDGTYEEMLNIQGSFDQYLDEANAKDDSLLYGGIDGISYIIESNSIYRDLLTAGVTSFATFSVVFCYFKRKYSDSMYKSLEV